MKFEVNCRLRVRPNEQLCCAVDDLKNLKLVFVKLKYSKNSHNQKSMNQCYIFISKTIWYSLHAHWQTYTHTHIICEQAKFTSEAISTHFELNSTSILLNVKIVNYFYDFLQSFSGFRK